MAPSRRDERARAPADPQAPGGGRDGPLDDAEARDDAEVRDDDVFERGRPKLTKRDTWRLVFATYRVSFPYLLIFVLGLLAATWLFTNVLFR